MHNLLRTEPLTYGPVPSRLGLFFAWIWFRTENWAEFDGSRVGPIDWEKPPSQRRSKQSASTRVFADLLVASAGTFVVYLLLHALGGDAGPSSQGIRTYFIDGLAGTGFLFWGVIVVSGLAALYAVADALRCLVQAKRLREHR